VYVTHDHSELVRLGDRAVLMADGRIAALGAVQQVARQADFSPAEPRRDASSIIEATVEGHTDALTLLSVDGQTLRTPRIGATVGTRLRIGIPARDVVIGLSRPQGLSIRNALDATITAIVPRAGGLLDVELRLGSQSLIARITSDAADDLGLVPGRPIVALVKSVAIDDGGY
jgi:molybdate transport system ATP-binding protein